MLQSVAWKRLCYRVLPGRDASGVVGGGKPGTIVQVLHALLVRNDHYMDTSYGYLYRVRQE